MTTANDLFHICASEGASSMHILSKRKGRYCQAQAPGDLIVRLEFQKKASYFIDTFESHDNNVICGRKITMIVDGKHRGEVEFRNAFRNVFVYCSE